MPHMQQSPPLGRWPANDERGATGGPELPALADNRRPAGRLVTAKTIASGKAMNAVPTIIARQPNPGVRKLTDDQWLLRPERLPFRHSPQPQMLQRRTETCLGAD